jgi:hypothetical protein
LRRHERALKARGWSFYIFPLVSTLLVPGMLS